MSITLPLLVRVCVVCGKGGTKQLEGIVIVIAI